MASCYLYVGDLDGVLGSWCSWPVPTSAEDKLLGTRIHSSIKKKLVLVPTSHMEGERGREGEKIRNKKGLPPMATKGYASLNLRASTPAGSPVWVTES